MAEIVVSDILDKSQETGTSEKSDVSEANDKYEKVQKIVILDRSEDHETAPDPIPETIKLVPKTPKKEKKVMISTNKTPLLCTPVIPEIPPCSCVCESIIPVIDPNKQKPILEARADLEVELVSLSDEDLYIDLIRPFKYLAEMGFIIVRNEFLSKIKFAYKIMIHNPLVAEAENPNFLFSWGPEEYSIRRNDNAVWLELLEMNVAPAFLNVVKFRFDMEEAVRYFLFLSNLGESENYEEGLEFIKAAYSLLSITETLNEEVVKNSSEAKQLDDNYLARSIFQENRETDALKKRLYLKLFNFEAVNPIELRVEILDVYAQAELAEYEFYKTERDIKTAIEKYKQDRMDRTMCHANIMDAYYLQSEECKKYLGIMSQKYEVEFDELDYSIADYKINIEKMKDTKKTRELRLKEMRRELDAFRREIFTLFQNTNISAVTTVLLNSTKNEQYKIICLRSI
ncbi:uncharacterized protein LOC119688352 [Teleopsis dalmanni]|uniref:uncharacterized protein LOC119688352 n=1 Tax=Teleopsis dalmanni TaxID=139649 RepID=UPI0018CDDB71|nr:uncharacterized protein LOC119688352 [Teleopsis dalmanni]